MACAALALSLSLASPSKASIWALIWRRGVFELATKFQVIGTELAGGFAALALTLLLALGMALGVVSLTHSATPALNSRNAESGADA